MTSAIEGLRECLGRQRSVQAPKKLREIAIARLGRRSLEGAAECGGNAGVRRRKIHSDDLTVHLVHFRCCNSFLFQLHRIPQRPR
jgi:hypothetical protein